jgi:hypothetical protein
MGTADYVVLHPDSTMMSIDPNATSNAISAWQGCSSATPYRPKFPYPTMNPISGAPYADLNVAYHSGMNPVNNTGCGLFPGIEGGQYIDVFQVAFKPGTHTTVSCSSYGGAPVDEGWTGVSGRFSNLRLFRRCCRHIEHCIWMFRHDPQENSCASLGPPAPLFPIA